MHIIYDLIINNNNNKIINISSGKSKSLIEMSKKINLFYKEIYGKKLEIEKNFIKEKQNYSTIKSNIMTKKLSQTCDKMGDIELKDLINFSSRLFNKKN